MGEYPYAVLIGRFQPFHLGHAELARRALELADRLIIVIGSHGAPRSLRNPWTSEERQFLISLSGLPAERYAIVKVRDSAYNFTDWIVRVRSAVEAIAGDSPVLLAGHYKDDTSGYLDCFPGWTLAAQPALRGGLSSTSIREAIFEGRLEEARRHVAPGARDAIADWSRGGECAELREEHAFIKEYRKKWEGSPYPPTFVTADAVVFALGQVLLVRRKRNPGKGRLALPGGFVDQEESVEKAALRELREETGIEVGQGQLRSSIRMREVFDHPRRDPRGRMITHAFMLELQAKELPALRAGDDAASALWLPLSRLESMEGEFFADHAQIVKFFMNRMR